MLGFDGFFATDHRNLSIPEFNRELPEKLLPGELSEQTDGVRQRSGLRGGLESRLRFDLHQRLATPYIHY